MNIKMDIQSITKPLLHRYVDFLKEIFRDSLLSAAVFGSFARGTAEFPGSDIDTIIVVKGADKHSFGERLKWTMRAEKKLSETEEYKKFTNACGWPPSIQEVKSYHRKN